MAKVHCCLAVLLPDWNTYRAKPCMSSAGQVGGAVSPISLLSLKVSSKPNPLGPSAPVNLTHTHTHTHTHTQWQTNLQKLCF